MSIPYENITTSVQVNDYEDDFSCCLSLNVTAARMFFDVCDLRNAAAGQYYMTIDEAKKLRDFLNFALPVEPTLTTCLPVAVGTLVTVPEVPTDKITYKDL